MAHTNSTNPLQPRNPSPLLVSDWHRLGAGLSVRFTLRGERIEAEWRPRLPTKREQRRILDRYRAARDAFLAAYGREIGGRVAVLEVTP